MPCLVDPGLQVCLYGVIQRVTLGAAGRPVFGQILASQNPPMLTLHKFCVIFERSILVDLDLGTCARLPGSSRVPDVLADSVPAAIELPRNALDAQAAQPQTENFGLLGQCHLWFEDELYVLLYN